MEGFKHALLPFLVVTLAVAARPVQAQQPTPQKQLRTYVPPDQIVSFGPETPFGQFVDSLSVVFQRVAGKPLIDLSERTGAIGVTVDQLQFYDALELVLKYQGLTWRETKRYFFIEEQGRRR